VAAVLPGRYGAQPFPCWRRIGLVQSWRSFEQLERFARDPALAHQEPWRRFDREVGAGGGVGIWHETFLVEAGR